jgi:excisionase family DNA binding protein
VIALRFYTVAEVARMFRIRKSYVYEMIAQGRLRAIKLSERRIRVPHEALEEFVRQEGGPGAAK